MTLSGTLSLTGSVFKAVERGWPRLWGERWAAVNTALQRLRVAYSATQLRPAELSSALNSFFIESAHMYDALKNDPSTGLTRSDVFAYVDTKTSLRVGQAYANTYKHLDRANPEDLRAYTSRVGDSTDGCFATIKFWSSLEPEQTIDALDLAEQCCQAWQEFLTRHQLL